MSDRCATGYLVMAMQHLELSSPHNWCDRTCERCTLASDCPCAPSPGQGSADAWTDVTRQLQVALQTLITTDPGAAAETLQLKRRPS